ncbi:MAG TPA: nucleotidyltransferase domain-containing protein [Gemmatimonadaceae bacterium]|nr:nucleotidyltransferase domain-containing protein [Gemmatimonadaceae bacterium]
MATMTLDDLVGQLRKAFGDGLRSVVLYGSAAAGEHIARRSDYNVLVLVDSIDLELLEREAAITRAWAEAGNPPPLTLTVREWRGSSDIFPMEYADILRHHRVLHGSAPFDGITVRRADLRLELEQQTMGKLLQLRRGILSAGGDRKQLLELLGASLSTFMVIFRAVVRYLGEDPPTDYDALCKRVTELTGVGTEQFARVVRHVRGEQKITEQEVRPVMAGYLETARGLAHYIDQLPTDIGESEA